MSRAWPAVRDLFHDDRVTDTQQSWFTPFFLSFSTADRRGLSDLPPVLPHARSLAMVERWSR